MSSLKGCLKAAKTAISQNDAEEALRFAKEALNYDNKSYFAYIFQGKSYELLEEFDKAIKAFKEAIKIEQDNLLGWKGYLQVAQLKNDHKLVFNVLGEYLGKLVEQEMSIAPTITDVWNYLHKRNYKKDNNLYELYLRSTIPGGPLYEYVGTALGSPIKNLRTLIDMMKARQENEINQFLYKEKMKYPRTLNLEQQTRLNSLVWGFYKGSDLPSLFERFIGICDDDEMRVKYEVELLRYKYEQLKYCPEKNALSEEVLEMIDGMVLVGIKSSFCWNLYFDLFDFESLEQLDLDKISFYFENFAEEGLCLVLYGYILSDQSPFSQQSLKDKITSKRMQNIRNSNNEEKELKVDDEHDAKLLEKIEDEDEPDVTIARLSPEETLSYMLEGYKRNPKSILANRIITSYYLSLMEYEKASDLCGQAIKALTSLQRIYGYDLKNTRQDILCSLAIVYTYFEAPKNFPRALKLYDKVLENDEENFKAKMGKGLISLESNDLDSAKAILTQIVEKHPDNLEARIEYSWCEIKLGNFKQGRDALIASVDKLSGMDLKMSEFRSKVYWRIAKSYLLENESELFEEACANLIKSIKSSKTYSQSYTSLGYIYHKFYEDKERAQKCFYRAFELNVCEIDAARYLVQELTSKKAWDIAEIICNRIINTEPSRRMLVSLSAENDKAWPYRVLGCSALNHQNDAKAVEWFQTALRISSSDLECWIGLGEAYLNCGRLDAAVKVFRHLLTIDADSWIVKYMLGVALCQMREYEEGIPILNEAQSLKTQESCILISLFQFHVEYAYKMIEGGFFGRAIDCNIEAIKFILMAYKLNKTSQSLWKSLSECLRAFLVIREKIGQFPFDELSFIFGDSANWGMNDFEDDNIDLNLASDLYADGKLVDSLSIFIILCAKAALVHLPNRENKYLRSIGYYNLGVAYLEYYGLSANGKWRDHAIKTFKKAIKIESNNASFWVALGNSYASFKPMIAQHCYIKATTLESRDADIWSNLAALYLKYGDVDLAEEAFARSQSVAPQYPGPWLGHALTAHARGEESKSAQFFTHAFVISNGKSPLAQILYGLSVIRKRIELSASDPRDIATAQEFSVANFAMSNYLKFLPDDELGLRVALVISERCKNYNMSIQLSSKLCNLLEQNYKEEESEQVLKAYMEANAQLARIHLGLSRFDEAVGIARSVLDVLGGVTDQDTEVSKILLSCRIVIGLAAFFSDDFDEALEQLKTILNSNTSSSKVVTLTAQILFAYNTPETKQAALDELFSYIEKNGASLLIVLTLGAISVVEDLEGYFPAIKEELECLSLSEVINDSFRSVPRLLDEISKKLDKSKGSGVWQKNAFLFPSDYHIWKRLSVPMALNVASLPATKLSAESLSQGLLHSGERRQIQRSLILSPHVAKSWDILKDDFQRN